MAEFATTHFGLIRYQEGDLLQFPAGLPAFESEHRFVAVRREETAPFVFLQSLTTQDLVFITLPVECVEADYEAVLAAEDAAVVGLNGEPGPHRGHDVRCLVIVTVPDGGAATANLMAPVIWNRTTGAAVQAIRPEPGYSPSHPLCRAEEVAPC